MKKLIAAALLAAMLALPALCLGEEAESALPQTGSVQFETLFQYQKEIVPVGGKLEQADVFVLPDNDRRRYDDRSVERGFRHPGIP